MRNRDEEIKTKEIRGKKLEIRLGRESDIHDWMILIDQVKASFPGLETEEAME